MPTQVGLCRLEKNHPTLLIGLTLNSQLYHLLGILCWLAILSHFLTLDSPVPLNSFTLLSSEIFLQYLLPLLHSQLLSISLGAGSNQNFHILSVSPHSVHWHLHHILTSPLTEGRLSMFWALVQLAVVHLILCLLKYPVTSSAIIPPLWVIEFYPSFDPAYLPSAAAFSSSVIAKLLEIVVC